MLPDAWLAAEYAGVDALRGQQRQRGVDSLLVLYRQGFSLANVWPNKWPVSNLCPRLLKLSTWPDQCVGVVLAAPVFLQNSRRRRSVNQSLILLILAFVLGVVVGMYLNLRATRPAASDREQERHDREIWVVLGLVRELRTLVDKITTDSLTDEIESWDRPSQPRPVPGRRSKNRR